MVGTGTMGMGMGMAMGTGNLTHAFTHGTLTCIPAGYIVFESPVQSRSLASKALD